MNKISLRDHEIETYVNIQKNIMNEKRFRILLYLNKEESTWSALMKELDIRNPKLLHDHITILANSNLIKKNSEGFYCLTKLGKSCIETNISLMKKLNEK
ncbi:MAG: ArsR family transcriptional regulator [Thaumarchaeota archaeon]|nr:ArsR family transcriptional regulator [Nitrososphaerota archaeon]